MTTILTESQSNLWRAQSSRDAAAFSIESSMADKAFALSPLSARSAQPDEADYEAIREAFMETARGRWFLGEYARRNRNADTSMVLDQMARIEQNLEELQQSTETVRPATPDAQLSAILATIRSAVDEATAIALTAGNDLTIEERLAPIRRGAQILKEISWLWREIGAEHRICDSIESQVDAIEKSCSDLARLDTRPVLRAFEVMRTRIETFASENGLPVTPAPAPETTSRPAGSELHPSLGSTPFALETLPPCRIPDTDQVAAIRRMSLVEKIAFFE